MSKYVIEYDTETKVGSVVKDGVKIEFDTVNLYDEGNRVSMSLTSKKDNGDNSVTYTTTIAEQFARACILGD